MRILDQPGEPPTLAGNVVEGAVHFLGRHVAPAVPDRLGQPDDGLERSTQVVSHHPHHVLGELDRPPSCVDCLLLGRRAPGRRRRRRTGCSQGDRTKGQRQQLNEPNQSHSRASRSRGSVEGGRPRHCYRPLVTPTRWSQEVLRICHRPPDSPRDLIDHPRRYLLQDRRRGAGPNRRSWRHRWSPLGSRSDMHRSDHPPGRRPVRTAGRTAKACQSSRPNPALLISSTTMASAARSTSSRSAVTSPTTLTASPGPGKGWRHTISSGSPAPRPPPGPRP